MLCPHSISSLVAKTIETFKESDLPLGDRVNLCYSSTIVTQGRGSGIVIATGMSAQIGRIADAMNSKNMKDEKPDLPFFTRVKEKILVLSGVRTGTPLQRKLTILAYVLLGCAIILALVVFSVAKFQITEEVTIYVRDDLRLCRNFLTLSRPSQLPLALSPSLLSSS